MEGGRENYETRGGRPYWPGNPLTGVTIGVGYDLGYQAPAQIKNDWAPYLKQADIDRLAAAAGKKGNEANAHIQQLSDISIPWDTAFAVLYSSLARWATVLERVPNARDLSPHSYGALVSLVYNRGGAGFTNSNERFSEMRQIRALMEERQFASIPAQLRSMKRLWPDRPLLLERREAEAKLFEKGLTQESGR